MFFVVLVLVLWVRICGLLSKCFWENCQNCSPGFPRKTMRRSVNLQKNLFLELFEIRKNFFSEIAKKFLTVSSKLHSTCSEELISSRTFWKVYKFLYNLGLSSEIDPISAVKISAGFSKLHLPVLTKCFRNQEVQLEFFQFSSIFQWSVFELWLKTLARFPKLQSTCPAEDLMETIIRKNCIFVIFLGYTVSGSGVPVKKTVAAGGVCQN